MNKTGIKADLSLVLPLLVLAALGLIGLFRSVDLYGYQAINVNAIALISLAGFAGIVAIVFLRRESYFFFLPLILLAFPNAINDLVPSSVIGPEGEGGEAWIPFFSHIDLYLILGIVLFRENFKPLYPDKSIRWILIILTGIVLLQFILLNSAEQHSMMGMYLFQIRYGILLLILFSGFLMNEQRWYTIGFGLILSIFLFLAESTIYTVINREDRLVSGTLRSNIFANTLSALCLAIIFSFKSFIPDKYRRVWMKHLLVVLCLTMIAFCQTRMAFIVFVSGFLIIQVLVLVRGDRIFKPVNLIYLALMAGLFIYSDQLPRFGGPDRQQGSINWKNYLYDSTNMTEEDYQYIMDLGIVKDMQENKISLTASNSSIVSRFIIWEITLDMIKDHPFIGIGPGRWNMERYNQGFRYRVLLDPHNDYLAHAVQYGIPASLLTIFLFFFNGCLRFWKRVSDRYSGYGIIIAGLAIAAMSNANSFKHQIAALLFLALLMLVYQPRKAV